MEFRLPIHWICSDALGVIFHMLKHSNLLGLSGLIVLGLTGSAIAAPKDFIGTWINKDSNSPGVSRFIVKEKSALPEFPWKPPDVVYKADSVATVDITSSR
jgi:hypothetical protein